LTIKYWEANPRHRIGTALGVEPSKAAAVRRDGAVSMGYADELIGNSVLEW
jgi:hypothetical protein